VPRGWLGGVTALEAQGYLERIDAARLEYARATLLDARVALHRTSGGKSDQLALQDQDNVAQLLAERDADALLRRVGEAARSVVWITSDMWTRLLATERGPERFAVGARELEPGIELRDRRVALAAGAMVDTEIVLRVAAAAARLDVPFERPTLDRLSTLGTVEWTAGARDAFVDLLGAGRGTVAVFESLDHVGVIERLVPEWRDVRARPQRNAYHRFTVDRHSLEAVVECAAVLDPEKEVGAGFDGDVARQARRDVLLLATLLHDIAKGRVGDHSEVGGEIAGAFGTRVGLDDDGVALLTWAVRNHLLLADTATRRDLSDESTIARFADLVGTVGRNQLLYALTIADSRATGPSAWNASKAGLVRELFVKADTLLTRGREALETDNVLTGRREALDALVARHLDLIEQGRLAVEWDDVEGGSIQCTVVAPDRTGLLATVASTLALVGFDIASASAYSHPGGMAVEVFTGGDRFGRLASADERERARATLEAALGGELDLDDKLRERTRRYRPRAPRRSRDVRVVVDPEASARATVVEVDAPDDIGLLGRIAAVFSDLGLDVTLAIVSTVGDRVVDVFYLRDASGRPLADRHAIDSLRATLLARLTTAVTLD
jgi:[protein-PII] uridylyltransferase